MSCPEDTGLSAKRSRLCSRAHAQAVAARLFEAGARHVSIVRTGDPRQPFRVVPTLVDGPNVEIELRYA
ncbi:hypothetical protein J2Y58_003995 [Sphingomonas sp. BE138]|uniref:hypothetical protein n=1 Tax=Sphingomonas sp. BE138 TaxID=2817845 RepID=UPI00286300EE|nr:hypothetical protein [Sphingomonas sp. BE138]MDR6790612.1 hypothetical protein [Sphingomonas sp. BE138]